MDGMKAWWWRASAAGLSKSHNDCKDCSLTKSSLAKQCSLARDSRQSDCAMKLARHLGMIRDQVTSDCLLYICLRSTRLPAFFCPACSAEVCRLILSAQNSSAAFAFGWPLGLRGALARLEGRFSALPFGFAVGGVLTSAGGTGPPFAK